MNEQSISAKQLKVIVLFCLVGDIAWYLPTTTAAIAQQDSWLGTLFGSVAGVGIIALFLLFARRFPGRTLLEVHRQMLGRFIGGVVSLLFLLNLIIASCGQIRLVGEFLTTQMMTETPMRVFLFMLSLVVVIAARTGLRTIAGTIQIFFLLVVVLIALLILMLIPESEPNNLRPMFNHSFTDFAKVTVNVMIFPYCQFIIFLMIFPSVKSQKSLFKIVMPTVCIGGAVIVAVVLLSILVLGPYMTAHHQFATYTMAKKISIANFLQRMEAILVISYLLTTLFKCAIYVYVICRGLTFVFGLRDYRVLVVPYLLLLFGLSFALSPDIAFFNHSGGYWTLWEIANALLAVGAVYAISLLRKKAGIGQ